MINGMSQACWDRMRAVAKAKEEGKTFKQIGHDLGFSASRAQAVFKDYQRWQACERLWYGGLSCRAANTLRSGLPPNLQKTRKLIQGWIITHPNELFRLKNCGKKTLRELHLFAGLPVSEALGSGKVRWAISYLERRGYEVRVKDSGLKELP